MDGRRKYALWIHSQDDKADARAGDAKELEDLLVNPDLFPGLRASDLFRIQQDDRCALLQVPTTDRRMKSPQHQVSVSKAVADLFGFSRRDCYVEKVCAVEKASCAVFEMGPVAGYPCVVGYIMGALQYLGRSDMWRLGRYLVGKCLYNMKRVEFEGIRATVRRNGWLSGTRCGQWVKSAVRDRPTEALQVKQVYIRAQEAEAGIVTANTKTIFRSESAKFYIFLQMSREMWEFDKEGDLFYEKALDGFLPELFERWRAVDATHLVSIVLFSRLYYPIERNYTWPTGTPPAGVQWDGQGRCFVDVYKVVVDWEAKPDWFAVLKALKREVHFYRQLLFDQVTVPGNDGRPIQAHANARAPEGNFLEATNLALNVFTKVANDGALF